MFKEIAARLTKVVAGMGIGMVGGLLVLAGLHGNGLTILPGWYLMIAGAKLANS